MSTSVEASNSSLSGLAPLMVKLDPGKVWNAAVISESVAKLCAQARRERRMTERLSIRNDASIFPRTEAVSPAQVPPNANHADPAECPVTLAEYG